jgi:hypothetical protein
MQEIYKKNYACIKKGTGQCKKTDVMSVPLPNHKQWAWRGVASDRSLKNGKKGEDITWSGRKTALYTSKTERKRG